MSGDGNSADPWGWLGLLKWSLEYTDGTKPSSDTMLPMSPEDKAFLETVMKEGIIDENKRMKTILKEVTAQMEEWKEKKYTDSQTEAVDALLEELRDIVEQIDYARAFAAMKGLNFLLGCVQETESLPKSTRSICLGLIATLCQHNPPVQKELLELGSLRILSELFLAEQDSLLRARIMQAISANVRSHELAENVFCELPQAPSLMAIGLGSSDFATRKRTLFLLRALVTSDAATKQRVQRFAACIVYCIDEILLAADKEATSDSMLEQQELVEMTLSMIEQLLAQRKSVDAVLARKDAIAATAVRRVAEIREMPSGEDRDYVQPELELWEQTLKLLARASPDE